MKLYVHYCHSEGRYGFHDGTNFVTIQHSLTKEQIDRMVDALVPVLSAPEEIPLFKFVFKRMAEVLSPTDFLNFVTKTMKA